ncbi:hypothetical protein UY3_04502 [Chelonia mydas]|uniref:Uncharacterized protein n=1 Tax=Chelonia mydas TaxID=8469 RepID=M7C1M7_CHEMY|nr:hypothetical protein UY3_04502 [Chelonia mydas]
MGCGIFHQNEEKNTCLITTLVQDVVCESRDNKKDDMVDEEEEEEENERQMSDGSILSESQEIFLTLEPCGLQDITVADHDAGEQQSHGLPHCLELGSGSIYYGCDFYLIRKCPAVNSMWQVKKPFTRNILLMNFQAIKEVEQQLAMVQILRWCKAAPRSKVLHNEKKVWPINSTHWSVNQTRTSPQPYWEQVVAKDLETNSPPPFSSFTLVQLYSQ